MRMKRKANPGEKKTEYRGFLQRTPVKSTDIWKWAVNELAPEAVLEEQAPEKDYIILSRKFGYSLATLLLLRR
jgi:hypothetical protein